MICVFYKKKHYIIDMEDAIQWMKHISFGLKLSYGTKTQVKWSNNSGRSRWPRCLGVGFAAAESGGFESHREHGCLSFVSVLCCKVEGSATGWSLVQRSPTVCMCVCVCVCVCVSRSVIRCNNNPLHPKKQGKKKRKKWTNNLLLTFSRLMTYIYVVPHR